MDPWLEKQLEFYNKFFTDEEKEQHEKAYFAYIFSFDNKGSEEWVENQPELLDEFRTELTTAGQKLMIEIGEDIIINGTGRVDCKPIGLLSSANKS